MERLSKVAANGKAILIIGSLLAFIFAVVLNAVLNIPGISPFNSTIGNLSHKYYTPITPADATFGIWGFIYLWQLVLVIYCNTLLCRKCNGTPLYISPGVVPSIFFLSYVINLAANPGWIVVWLEERLTLALMLLVAGVITLVICLATSCRELEKSGASLEQNGFTADIWCTRIIVQNGIAFYLSWVTCATAINAIVAAHYVHGVSLTACSYGALICLNLIIVIWFLSEIVFDRQLRYVFAHYATYIAAFTGIYIQNFDPDVLYQWYALGLLVAVSALAAVKLIIIIVRSIRDPIHYPQAAKKVKFQPLKSDIAPVAY